MCVLKAGAFAAIYAKKMVGMNEKDNLLPGRKMTEKWRAFDGVHVVLSSGWH